MKSGIEMFGLLWVFAFIVLVIPSMLGLVIDYKKANEASSLIVEIIEVHNGLNDSSEILVEDLLDKYPDLEVEILRQAIGKGKYVYTINTSINFTLDLLNLSIPINVDKLTKGVKE